MNLTDLVPGKDFHRLVHNGVDLNAEKARMKRITEAYGELVRECIRICGGIPPSISLVAYYAITMSTLCVIDTAIEAADKETARV